MAIQIGGLSNNGAIPRTLNTNPNQSLINGGVGGVLSTPNTSRTAGLGLSVPSIGTNPGVIPKPDTTYTHTTTTNQTGGTTSKPTPNPSVLAQQKALNAQGAGLVEDGIAGPLTQAAIAKYGSKVTTTPTSSNAPKTETPPKLVSSANPAEQIQNVGQAGTYTPQESAAQTNLATQSQTESPAYKEAMNNYNVAKQALADYEAKLAETNKNISSQGISLESARGQEANIGQAATAEHAALQGAVSAASNVLNAANAQQGLQVQAGTAAQAGAQTQAQRGLGAQQTVLNAGLLTPVAPGQVMVNPVTGQQGGMVGTMGTGGLDIPTIAQQVANGQMTIDQANTALGGNIGLTTALRSEITKLNPNFNFAQSSTLAGQQGSITPALNYATQALSHAKDTLSNLSIPGQTSNVGALSDVSNWFSNLSGIGKEATRTKEGALAEARSAIQSVLASVKGGNPTEYRDQSYALLPNNATPADIDAAIQNLNTLGGIKQNIYGAPGQSTKTPGSSTGSSLWNW